MGFGSSSKNVAGIRNPRDETPCTETHAEKDDHFAQKKNLKIKCSWGGSNSRPSDYETDALPTELQKHITCYVSVG